MHNVRWYAFALCLCIASSCLSTVGTSASQVDKPPFGRMRRSSLSRKHGSIVIRQNEWEDAEETAELDATTQQLADEPLTSTATRTQTPQPAEESNISLTSAAIATDDAAVTTKTEPTEPYSRDSRPTLKGNPATLPTPISSAVKTEPVALFVPLYDQQVDPGPYNVQYLGPGNGHSTLYQVVYSADAQRAPVTATLIEDASNAVLMGAQQTTVLPNGQSTAVWAAVSCGFQDGLKPTEAMPSAGQCMYWNHQGAATSTWSTAVFTITAQTTITPSPGAVQASIAAVASAHGQFAVKPHVSGQSGSAVSARLLSYGSLLGGAILVIAVMAL